MCNVIYSVMTFVVHGSKPASSLQWWLHAVVLETATTCVSIHVCVDLIERLLTWYELLCLCIKALPSINTNMAVIVCNHCQSSIQYQVCISHWPVCCQSSTQRDWTEDVGSQASYQSAPSTSTPSSANLQHMPQHFMVIPYPGSDIVNTHTHTPMCMHVCV